MIHKMFNIKKEKNIVCYYVFFLSICIIFSSCGNECPSMGDCNYTYNSTANVGISNGSLCNVRACNARSAYNNKAQYSAYCDCK